MRQRLEITKAMMLKKTANGVKIPVFQRPGFRRQLTTLLWRDAMVAIRDPTLYYLQVALKRCLPKTVALSFATLCT